VMRIEPTRGQSLGPSKNNPGGDWQFHDVVLKNGRIYDSFTGSSGMPVSEYMRQFSYVDDLKMVAR
jgi:hypothetical protein